MPKLKLILIKIKTSAFLLTIKTLFDFTIYNFKMNISIGLPFVVVGAVSLLLFLYSFLSLANSLINGYKIDWQLVASVFSVIISIVNYLLYANQIRKYKDYKLISSVSGDFFEKVCFCSVSSHEPGVYIKYKLTINFHESIFGYIFMSEELNRILWNKRVPLIMDISLYRERELQERIKKYWHILNPFLSQNLIRALREGSFFFNETKLCIGRGFIKTETGLKVECKKGRYYDTYLTNGIYNKLLVTKYGDNSHKSANDAFEGANVFLKSLDSEESFVLESFEDSKMNNEFGISTIAMTSDNFIFLMIQSHRAQSSNRLIAPSGSGSCDYEDIFGSNLRETVTYAMQRELWEETGNICDKKSKREAVRKFGKTRLIGFFRWIEKCGKPEFLGVTKINFTFEEITKRGFDESEVFKSPILKKRVDSISMLKEYIALVEKESRRQNMVEHDGVSVPALACLLQLKKMCYDLSLATELALFWGIENH